MINAIDPESQGDAAKRQNTSQSCLTYTCRTELRTRHLVRVEEQDREEQLAGEERARMCWVLLGREIPVSPVMAASPERPRMAEVTK